MISSIEKLAQFNQHNTKKWTGQQKADAMSVVLFFLLYLTF